MVVIPEAMQMAIAAAVHATTVGESNNHTSPTTELDSHVNLVVLGRQATIISRSNTSIEVQAFSDD